MEACWINSLGHVTCAACIPDASVLVSEWGYSLKSMKEVLGNIKTFSRMLVKGTSSLTPQILPEQIVQLLKKQYKYRRNKG